MSAPFAVGDTVRVTFEGKVERINKIPGDETAVELKINPTNGDFVQYIDTKDVESIEKIEPPVEVFGPGDVVRHREYRELVYSIGSDGYYAHDADEWRPGDPNTNRHRADPFNANFYERVEVG